MKADQTLSKQQAKYTYDSSTAYGSYINTEYSTTLQELQNTVDSAESTLEQAKSSLEDYRAQLEEVKEYIEENLGDKYEVQIYPNELLGAGTVHGRFPGAAEGRAGTESRAGGGKCNHCRNRLQ